MKQRIFINNKAEWELLKTDSLSRQEIILFKYSPICAQSLDVQQEITAWYDTLVNDNIPVLAFVNVIGAKDLSRSIAAETGVTHESPQVIWFNKNGDIKFSASHRSINSENMNDNVAIK